jgi:16S rRNA (guanine966-N2)-methyltransferase
MPAKRSSVRTGKVRIIGGRWRRRLIPVPPDADVRPTPDRVRETLFNWLAPVVEGARCLDLFAGTGALGIEALSRGASEAWFVERHARAAGVLEQFLHKLDCQNSVVVTGDALPFLQRTPQPFDLVFLDPPFDRVDLKNLCTLLDRGWLRPGAHIYLERSKQSDLPELPADWQVLRERAAGDVRYTLARKS